MVVVVDAVHLNNISVHESYFSLSLNQIFFSSFTQEESGENAHRNFQ